MKDEDIEKLMEGFLSEAVAVEEINLQSAKKYRSQLKRFFKEMKVDSLSDISKERVFEFISNKKEAGVKSLTIRGYIYALKKFLSYLENEEKVKISVDLNNLPIPRGKERGEVAYLNEEETLRFIQAIKENTKNVNQVAVVRFLALVYFLLETGARISEVLSIKLEKIDWGNCEVEIVGKGNKKRVLYFKEGSKYWLKRYIDSRIGNSGYLFATLNGSSVWRQTEVDDLFRKYRKLAGISKPLTAHILRHTFCTQLLMRGVPMNVVARLAGHSSVEVTMKYYAGVVEVAKAKEIIKDEHFDFVPKVELDEKGVY
jgi:integrase/recombinase XerD